MDLPNEVVLEILSYLASEKSTLAAFALISRRAKSLAYGILFRDFSVHIASARDKLPRLKLLVRTFNEHPGLAALVRTLELKWNDLDGEIEDDRHPGYEVRAFFTSLPRLKALQIGKVGNWAISTPIWKPEIDYMPFLRHLKIRDAVTTTEDIRIIMRLTSVETISVEHLVSEGGYLMPTISNDDRRSASLLYLDVGYTDIGQKEMRDLLKYPRALQRLRCSPPGFVYSAPSERSTLVPLCPGRFLWVLRPVKRSLVQLDMCTAYEPRWDSHDGSRLSLRDFTLLNKLSILSLFLFTEHRFGSARSLVHLLPASLEELHVRHPPETCARAMLRRSRFPSVCAMDCSPRRSMSRSSFRHRVSAKLATDYRGLKS